MKHITIITSLLILLASHASATGFEGRMDCKVKSNKILEIEEGIKQEYSGSEKEFKTGEILKLNYGIYNSGEPFILLKDEVRDHETYKVTVNPTWESTELWTWETDNFAIRSKLGQIKLLNDQIMSSSIFPIRLKDFGIRFLNSNLFLTRYYKNDWQGIISNHPSPNTVQVYTLDCRNKVDEFDRMKIEFSKLVAIDDAKEAKNDKVKEEAEKAQNVVELYELQNVALAIQLDEANRRIAELEAAQE